MCWTGTWNPCPPGVPGELCVGGEGLARGYLGRPDLTAEAFVPDALSGGSGQRLYRTGDLVRFGPDGALEFLGRLDDQVKVRGFRIEPGEIEAALARHPAVADAAVVTAGGEGGAKRLVAFVAAAARPVATPGPELAANSDLAADLRAHLRASLPEYMIPAAIVTVACLPKTTSGKTDRRALATQAALLPGPPGADCPVTADPGGSATEDTVAAIWAEVLGRGDFGRRDNFFDLGGHSLLLVEVAARLGRAFGRRIPMVELFRHTTVHALAAHLDAASSAVAALASAEAPAPALAGVVAAPDAVETARARGTLRSARREAAAARKELKP